MKNKTKTNIKISSDILFYPDFDDPKFYEKIFIKKEFNENLMPKSHKKISEVCDRNKEYILLEQQNFLKNYISVNTPYNGALLIHGTGVGKTCAAISVAENFKQFVKTRTDRIIVLVKSETLANNFYDNIYNIEKNRSKNYKYFQCTQDEYELSNYENKTLGDDKKKKKIIEKIDSKYYINSFGIFSHQVQKELNDWTGKDSELTEHMIEKIKSKFSNRVMIIDEVHNIKEGDSKKKKFPPILEAIVKYSINMKLILLSATPMYNRPDEIIYLINILRINDNRSAIKKKDYFIYDKNNFLNNGLNIIPEKEKEFMKIVKGYISYLRGNKPPAFPYRIEPREANISQGNYWMNNKIDPKYRMKYTKTNNCPMNILHYNFYNKFIKSTDITQFNNSNNNSNINDINNNNNSEHSGNINLLLQISNIIFPTRNSKILYGERAYNNATFKKNNVKNKFTGKTEFFITPNSSAFIKGKSIFDKVNIGTYSSKFKNLLSNIINSKGDLSEGIILIYSRFKESGVYPIAMMLEQNGFTRFKDNDLLRSDAKNKPICYQCGKTFHKKTDHEFFKAQYYLATGDIQMKKRTPEAIKTITRDNNINGKTIKIIIGTRTISEGIDLKNVRQIHIIEPWYNMANIEQLIGRGIRFCSHTNLPSEKHNVEIFKYTSTLPVGKSGSKSKLNELIDEHYYRRSEIKDISTKNTELLLKRSAVDCALFKNGNLFSQSDHKKVDLLTSRGMKISFTPGDKPCSRECDYKKNCNYKCIWEPSGKPYTINYDTYDSNFIKRYINLTKQYIFALYKQNYYYSLDDIISRIISKNNKITKQFIYRTIDLFINNKNNLLIDRYERKGYLIHRGNYYIFQPINLLDENIPIHYRDKPLSIKKKEVLLDDISINKYINGNNSKNKQNDKHIISISTIINNFNKTKNIMLLDESMDIYIMDMIIDRYIVNDIESILKYIIRTYDKKNTIDPILSLVFNYFIENNYIVQESGHTFYCYNNKKYYNKNGKWISSAISAKYKKQEKYDLPKNNIYGIMGIEKNVVKFKIFNISQFSEKLTIGKVISKKSEIRGRVCTTFQVNEIKQILNGIDNTIKPTHKSKNYLCDYIELLLRRNNSMRVNGKLWFIKNL